MTVTVFFSSSFLFPFSRLDKCQDSTTSYLKETLTNLNQTGVWTIRNLGGHVGYRQRRLNDKSITTRDKEKSFIAMKDGSLKRQDPKCVCLVLGPQKVFYAHTHIYML